MKATQILCATVLTLCSASAFAQWTVKTEAQRDQANLSAGNNYPVIKFDSTRTRADVTAELKAARLGKPMQASTVKPNPVGAPQQSRQADPTLYQGA